MKIEKIVPSKHKQERILVFLEGGTLIRVTEDELLRFGLYPGLDISPDTVVELEESAALSQTRIRAANMLSARPLSRNELQKRLRGRGATERDAKAAADWLENVGALDDLAYAKAIVRHYSERGYGEARLRDELYRRGIPRELWDDALAGAPDPQETLARVIAARTKGRALDAREKKRIFDMLLRRGFSIPDVRAAMNALDAELEEDT